MLLSSLYSLLFPSFCLHCSQELDSKTNLLCPACFDLLTPSSYPFVCFQQEGPASSLVYAFTEKDMPYLAKSLAGFMLLHHQEARLKTPDLIAYIPQSLIETTIRGYNPSALLACELAKLFQVGYMSANALEDVSNKQILLVGDVFTEKIEASQNCELLFLLKHSKNEHSTEKGDGATKEEKTGECNG